MRGLRSFAVLLGLCLAAAPVFSQPPVPRQSPEFVIYYPGGKQGLLSSYKGKVVVLEFILTTCPHCQENSRMLSRLYKELGPKGFQPLAVAINPMALMLVNDFTRDFGVTFPVGASERDPALNYLKVTDADRWVVPQVVLIDRAGMIRMQTPPKGDEKMQTEAFLRAEIEKLLGGGGTTSKAVGKKPAAKKST